MIRSKTILCLASAAAMLAGRASAQLPSGTWQLQWADEFTRNSLDTKKGWSYNYPWGPTHNHDAYMSPDNVTFGDGTLTITAERQAQGGKAFTSGAVSTGYTNFTVTGGYVEARILLPDTPGSWPAFWGLQAGWPPEADIMEYPIDTAAGSGYAQDQYHTAFHYTNSSGGNSAGAGQVNPSSAGDLGGAYHNFGMQWVPNTSVAFFFDGTQVSSFTSSEVGDMDYMYLILNYAVGGWPGTPNTTEWPAGHTDEMKVDWVRVWKQTGTSTTNWIYSGTSEDVQWGTSSNWSNGAPDLGGVTANFSTVTPAEQRLDWSGERTVSNLNFDGSTRYVVGNSSDRLLLVGSNNASGNASITVQATSTVQHTIRADVELWSTLAITNNSAQQLLLSGQFFGGRGINVDGAGPVVFANSNIYSGDTIIDSGTQGPGVARVTTSNPFGTGTVIIGEAGNGTTGRLEIENNATVPNAISFNGRTNSSVGILNRSGNNTLSGTISANVGGSIYQIQSDAGTLTLGSAAGVALQAASGARTFTLQGAGDGIVRGNIQNGGGTVSITKGGIGTWTLNGANTFTGATQVSSGKLILNNVSLANTSGVTVSSGATLTAKGTITTGGTLTSSGTVDLVDGVLNTVTVGGGVSLSNSTLNVEVGSSSADRIAVSGAASGGANNTVNISPVIGQSMVSGNSYTILTASSGLSAANFTVGTKPASLGFFQFNLSTPTATALLVNVTGNATPATAYWTGIASTNTADANNNWGTGPSINTSNWSTDAAGTIDPQQLPGSTTNVILTAANASGSGGSLTTQLDSAYAVKGLAVDVSPTSGITSSVLNTNSYTLAVGSSGISLAATSNASSTIGGTGSVLVSGNQSWANNSNSRALNISTGISALSGPTTLTFNGTGTGGLNLSGVFADGGGTLATVFNQAGTTVLSASNTYTGTTTVSSGVVEIASGGKIVGDSIITSGGTLRLNGGTDAIADTATIDVQSGGTLDIRAATAGTPKTETLARLTGAGTVTRGNTGTTTLTLGSTNLSGTFSGTIQNGSGVLALVKTGTGTQTLAGPSTYSGGTTINDDGGALLVTHSSALGTGNVTIGNGNTNPSGVLQLSGGIAVTSVPTINLASRSLSNDGGSPHIENVAGNNSISANLNINNTGGSAANILSTAGTLTLTGTMSSTGLSTARGFNFYGSGNGAASGVISDGTVQDTFVQKDGAGTWTLSGNNSYTGGTTINAGTLILSGNNNFGSGGLSAIGGTVLLSAANSYTGTTTIDAGTVIMNHPSALGSSSISLVGGGGSGGDGSGGGSGGGTLVVRTDGGDTPYNINVGSGNILTLTSDVKTGSVGINHTLGTLAIGRLTTVNVLAGSNVASGNPAITLGNVTLSSGFGAGSTTFNPTTAKITLGAVTTSTNSAKTLILDGTSTGNLVTGAISNGSNVVTLLKSNSSTWTLSAASTYTGSTTVSGGTLRVTGMLPSTSGTTIGTSGGDGVLQAANTQALGSNPITFDSTGNSSTARLELSGNISLNNAITLPQRNNTTVAIENTSGSNSLSGSINIVQGGTNARIQSDAGQLTLAGGITTTTTANRTVTLQGAGNGLVSGIISSGSGTINIAKEGVGIWTLSGANTYTGTTTVSGGTLIVNTASGSGLTTVASGATLGGSGTIAGGLSSSGNVSPGTSAGTMSVTGNATLAAGSSLIMEIGGAALTTQYDHFNVSGQLTAGGNLNVALINSFSPNAGDSFDLLNFGTLSGTFANVNLPALPGLVWDTSSLYLNGSLSVALAGDFNGDDSVDAADYVVWRKTDNTPTGYNSWRTNFGATVAGGAGTSLNGAVPEPSSIGLFVIAIGAAIVRFRSTSIRCQAS